MDAIAGPGDGDNEGLLDGTGDGTFESDGANVVDVMLGLIEGSSDATLEGDGAFVLRSKILSSCGLGGIDGDRDVSDGFVLGWSVGRALGFDDIEGLRDGAPLLVGSFEGSNDGSFEGSNDG